MTDRIDLENDERHDKRGRYLSQCEGKISFDSAHRAYAVASRRQGVGKAGSPYRCRYCRGWHIGTSAANRWSNRRR